MLIPDFNEYSLALIKDDKIVFSSDKSGLRPLLECINKFRLKISDCILHDKFVGLAAARLIVYSKIIFSVNTNTISKPAKKLLEEKNIIINANNVVENILTKEGSDICSMEKKALSISSNEDFFLELNKLFRT